MTTHPSVASHWDGPYASDHPFLEAPHSHGCPFRTHGGACTCPSQATDGALSDQEPNSGTPGHPEVSQGLTEAHSAWDDPWIDYAEELNDAVWAGSYEEDTE